MTHARAALPSPPPGSRPHPPPTPPGKSTRRARLPSLQVRDAERHMGGRRVQPASPPRGARLPLSAAVTSQSSPASAPTTPPPARRKPTSLIAPGDQKRARPPAHCHLPLVPPLPRPRGRTPRSRLRPQRWVPPLLAYSSWSLLFITLFFFFLSPEAFTGGQGTGFLVGGVECHSAFCTEEFF